MTRIFTARVLRVWLKLTLSLILSSCGSSSSNVGAPLDQSAKLISGKAFGYYGDCNQTCISEYGNTVSYYQSAPWLKDYAQIAAGISLAQHYHLQIILSIPDGDVLAPDCDLRIRNLFTYLDSQSLLKDIYAIYPKDEYNLNSKLTEAQIRTANSCVRNAASNFEGTRGKPLYGIYTCSDPWIALDDLDIIACDDYEIGDLMLSRYLPGLKKYGKPIFLIPGGACPWNYNPYAMVVVANSDEQIVGLMAFLYADGWGGTMNCGIKSSSLLPFYQSLLH